MKRKKVTDPVHPGEILFEEYMKPAGLTMNGLALALRVPTTRISGIVNATRSITVDTALRLGRYFSTSPQLWMNLQVFYDLRAAEKESGKQIQQQVQPLKAA